jgi:hypothetical protein
VKGSLEKFYFFSIELKGRTIVFLPQLGCNIAITTQFKVQSNRFQNEFDAHANRA